MDDRCIACVDSPGPCMATRRGNIVLYVDGEWINVCAFHFHAFERLATVRHREERMEIEPQFEIASAPEVQVARQVN